MEFFARFIEKTGIKAFIRFGDTGPSNSALKDAAARSLPFAESVAGSCPVGDHQAHGSVEVSLRALKRPMRAVRMQLEKTRCLCHVGESSGTMLLISDGQSTLGGKSLSIPRVQSELGGADDSDESTRLFWESSGHPMAQGASQRVMEHPHLYAHTCDAHTPNLLLFRQQHFRVKPFSLWSLAALV